MKRTVTFLVLFILATGVGDLLAQVPVHRNIGLDSLMAIMQKRTSEKIYYQSDEPGIRSGRYIQDQRSCIRIRACSE